MCRRINRVFVNKDGHLLITSKQYQRFYAFFYRRTELIQNENVPEYEPLAGIQQ
jgi:hypothetical protein